jgi:hypothetical protein
MTSDIASCQGGWASTSPFLAFAIVRLCLRYLFYSKIVNPRKRIQGPHRSIPPFDLCGRHAGEGIYFRRSPVGPCGIVGDENASRAPARFEWSCAMQQRRPLPTNARLLTNGSSGIRRTCASRQKACRPALRGMICYGRLARPKPASPRSSSGFLRGACGRRSRRPGDPPDDAGSASGTIGASAWASPARRGAGDAKSRPGMTPCGFVRDCQFPGSVAAIITGEWRQGSAYRRKRPPGTKRAAPFLQCSN